MQMQEFYETKSNEISAMQERYGRGRCRGLNVQEESPGRKKMKGGR